MSLSEKKIRDAKPEGKTRIIWDDRVTGLGLRITGTGAKAFVLSYRDGGKKRLATIGRPGEASLAAIRELAGAELTRIRGGDDGILDRKAERASKPTVAEGLDLFSNGRIPQRINAGRMTETTAKEYRRQIEKHVRPALGKKRIEAVTQTDVQRLIAGLPAVTGNRVLALISAIFTDFERRGLRVQGDNPAKGIDRAIERPRERVLSPNEVQALGTALNDLEGNPHAILAIRVAALTGLRIGEVRSLQWASIDFEAGNMAIEGKTGPRIHSLSAPVAALLSDALRIGPFVIAGRTDAKALDYKAIHKVWRKACASAEIEGARLHDLRRTIVTNAADAGASAVILRDLLGHRTMTIAARYAQKGQAVQELRNRLANQTAALMDGADGGEVVKLRGGNREAG